MLVVSWAEMKDPRNCSYAQKASFSQMLCTNLFTSLLVSIFAKIIHPPDRCGISRSWLNSMVITQVHIVLGTIKGHSKMCSFVTQHIATDVTRKFTGAVGREFNINFSTISCPSQHCFREFGSTSNRPHNRRPHLRHCVGERFADVNLVKMVPPCRWGYGMGRHNLQTMNTTAFYRWQFECTEIPWWDPESHCRAIHPPPSPHVSAWWCRKDLYTISASWKCPSSSMSCKLTRHVTDWACLGCSGSSVW